MNDEKFDAPLAMPCVVVGGCADGVMIPRMLAGANFVVLSRPDHIKPLAISTQTVPEVAHAEDEYEVHVMSLTNSDRPTEGVLFGIAVIKGQSLVWAFTKLLGGYSESVARKLLAAGLMTGTKH
jgi:hypothetical protein